MKIKLMMIGDVVGSAGVEYLSRGGRLRREAAERGADFIIVNGENSAEGNGITPTSARALLDAGADVITGGNHTLRKKNVFSMLEDGDKLIRPANYSSRAPGHGFTTALVKGYRFLIINLAGQVYMDSPSSPFDTLEKILDSEKGGYDAAIVDVHAEATSEKLALARCFDGRITVAAGTHTHVQTADASVLPGGCGYITDLGMCGSHAGILGVKTESILFKFRVGSPVTFEPAEGDVFATGAVFEIEMAGSNAACISAEAIKF